MPKSTLLTDGFLAHYACQTVICAFVATLLATLSRLQPTGLMRWWSVSWAALSCYTLSAGASFWFVLHGHKPTDPTRLVTGVLSMAAAGVQLFSLVYGWMAERRGSNSFSAGRLLRVLAGAVLIGLAATMVLHFAADSRMRFVVKVSVRGLLVAGVYVWIGVAVLRRRSLIALIRFWLGLGLVAFGAKHMQYAYATLFHEGATTYETEYLMQFVDLALQVIIACPMLLWVCLRFADRSRMQRIELRRRAEMIEEQDVQLSRRQRMSTVGRMAAGVAHDFNNVLAVIQSWTDILRHDSQLDELGREGVGEIDAAAKQAGAISQQLMLFGGKQVLQSTLITLREVVDEAARRVPQLSQRRFTVDVEESLPMIRSDRAMLVTALQNLLLNAFDATSPSGDVSVHAQVVSVAGKQAEQLEVEPGDYMQVTVADDGAGIPDEVAQKIFEPFFTTKEHGNGLGLPSVHGFVHQSKGGMQVDSSPGGGTRMMLFLPVSAQSVPAPKITLPTIEVAPPSEAGAESSNSSSSSSSSAQVMVVDDQPTIAGHVTRVLRRAGFEVVSFTSPAEALAEARRLRTRLSVLVTDVRMPTCSGQELARQVLSYHAGIRVVFVTGYADDIDLSKVPLTAPPTLLQKPISGEALVEAVRSQMSRAPRSLRADA